jgi:hypothetical protein
MKNGEVLHNREQRNIICSIKQRKSNWTGHKNCFLECVIEGQMEGMGRWRCKQLLGDLKEKRR